MSDDQQVLRGVIGSIVYKNEDNGYSILRLLCDNGQTVTVVGTIPQPVTGEKLMVTGRWSSHPSYGKQFEAEFLERLLPETKSEILRYLSGRAIKGIGPVLANRIVHKFGEDTLRIIETDPDQLSTISGISKAKARAISQNFCKQTGIRHLMEYFTSHQLPAELAIQVYKQYGDVSREMLEQDPYLLTDDPLNCPFELADRFALETGVEAKDTRRTEAGILHTLRQASDNGHSFLPENKLLTMVTSLLSCSEDAVLICTDKLAEYGRIVRDTLKDIPVIYLSEMYEAEQFCREHLLAHAKRSFPLPNGWKMLLKAATERTELQYSEDQLCAIEQAVCQGLLLLTGGPGTGKTTVLSAILEIYDQLGLRYFLSAPTGRAAKRLTEITGRDATTIHRLLEATIDPFSGQMCFSRDESNPLKANAIIVDEMSMVDLPLLHNLLQATRQNTRLIFVGDPDQLPPVGPGCPFRDCLKSGVLPAVCLTEVFRQAQQSLIVMNAHSINRGKMPDLSCKNKDFFFIPCRSDVQLQQTVSQLMANRLPQKMGIPPEQIQVLSPTRKGPVGTWELNEVLQGSLNPSVPGKKEKKFGNFSFREGDRVMQIRNNYDIMWRKRDGSEVGTGIFNGDVGTILSVDTDAELITVEFDDRQAEYEFDSIGELEPAYAITVHKSQGSEYRAVILCAWNGSAYLLSRSVLYTAVTRAKELLIIVGREEVITAMTENAKGNRRYTGLKLRLQQE